MRIVAIIGLYFISIALYAFLYGCAWYADYYNYITASMGIFLGLCTFKKRFTEWERGAISLFIIYRMFCVVYLVMGNIVSSKDWMDQNIYFIITVGLSAFLAWFMYHLRKKDYETF